MGGIVSAEGGSFTRKMNVWQGRPAGLVNGKPGLQEMPSPAKTNPDSLGRVNARPRRRIEGRMK
jgi:hypothetical protein